MKSVLYVLFSFLLFYSTLTSQVTTDSLTLKWEASVNYGTYGQRTVFVGQTLYHFGGIFSYGIPYSHNPNEFSFMEHMNLKDNYWIVDTTKTIFRTYINAEMYAGKIYIFGGAGVKYNSEVEIFDPVIKNISFGSPLPFPRKAAGSAQNDNLIGSTVNSVKMINLGYGNKRII